MIAAFCPWMVFLIFLCAFLHRLDSVHGGDSVRGGNTSFASSFTRIPRDLYHSSGSLLKEINALVDRHPEKLAMEFIRASNKGYGADVPVVTYNHAKQKEKNDSRYRILLSFGQHGRELITTEVALHLLSILSEEHSPHGIAGFDPTSLEKNLENLVIKVVPMENLKGRELVEAGEFCERRNAGRGVDLNRNWSVDWGKKEKDYDPYEENPGAAPFSEPEVQIMRMLSKSFNPHIWVNVHSGMEALFMPYDHKNATPDGFTSQLMKSMLKGLNHHHFQDRCLVGSGGGSVGYLAHGTTTDYMYEIAKVPFSFTFEIYGDPSASSKDCFKMFNPVDAATFQRVIKEWCGAFLSIFKAGPELLKSANMTQGRWISIGAESLEGLLDGNSREKGRKMDGLEFGMSEMRTYFRLFMLSCGLLMFMFCSRISKAKFRQGCQYML
ncbi:mast cell carboxypeptidase A isoform X2 [Phalaenopsis equestris]|uniref:mast cell carboxypeptidase A isoform X2 n=1 Tax=Phalaenopsis equestris TaxID=78828 RepID=UPI0009E2392F|nr:mast cell carboxypeptidase A isoform X2 [Phalaenopsis equestris]